MKLKKMKKIIIFFIGILVIFSTNLNAEILNTTTSNSIVSLSSQKVNLNTEFYLILNLSNISFTKFKVEITNTSSLKTNELTSPVSRLSNNAGITSFTVDKTSISLDKLGLVYTSTAQASNIDFKVTITSLDEDVNSLQEDINELTKEISVLTSDLDKLKESLGSIEEDTEEYEEISQAIEDKQSDIDTKTAEKESKEERIENFEEEKMSEEISIEVYDEATIIPENGMNEQDKSAWGDMDSMEMKDKFEKEMNMEKEKMSSSMKEMMTKMSGLEMDLENANNTISSLTSSNTYQGSQNNYLENLEIKGVELKNEFKKTTSNYFATVDKDVTSVTITAEPEDSSSTVTIYGNTDLQDGKNKIIISVTSESGSVRNYKIYITK